MTYTMKPVSSARMKLRERFEKRGLRHALTVNDRVPTQEYFDYLESFLAKHYTLICEIERRECNAQRRKRIEQLRQVSVLEMMVMSA